MFESILVTLVTPLAAVAFAIPELVGEADYAQLSVWNVAAIVIVPTGCFLYEWAGRRKRAAEHRTFLAAEDGDE